MPKRFTDSNKWDDPFFTKLPNDLKLVWLYILDKCDYAGIYKVNFDLIKYQCNCKKSPDEIFNVFNNRIVVLKGDKWFIKKFIKFQYPKGLDSNKPAIVGVKRVLSDYNLLDIISDVYNDNGIIANDYVIVKDKDKDKDKVKDKDKDKDISTKILDTFKSTLEENRKFYIDKYTGRDHELEFALMEDWISSNPTKAKKKKNWNLFIQSWLNRAKIDYVKAREVEANKPLRVMDVGNSYKAEDEYERKMREEDIKNGKL